MRQMQTTAYRTIRSRFQLQPTAPFDFHKILIRPNSRPYLSVRVEDETYLRVIRLGEKLVPIRVTSSGTIDTPCLTVDYGGSLAPQEQTELQQRIWRIFSCDVDVVGFHELAADDEVLSTLRAKHRGLRPILDSDLFESMVKVIIGQQLTVQFAATLVDRLVDLTGTKVTWDGQSLVAFPAPEEIARLSVDSLRALSFSQRKAEYVIDLARAIVEKRVDLESLWVASDADVFATLLPLRGIGRWTVECFLLFGMGRRDLMPAADIGVQNAVHKLYQLPIRPSEAEIRCRAEAWQPWRSYVTYYLWQSLIEPQ